ncbi:YciI family protein [Mesorhizobium sp. KR9-304]|uniref:YciI family protein n=1 Tax=Mesorhizobium sp. KR9-304 TaxID=3156614 RepID=UPI0032B3A432
MLYAILAYHEEAKISSLTSEEDAALMGRLLEVQAKMVEDGSLGPQVRLSATKEARTVRASGMVLDGPFAETKEQLLGFYVVNCDTHDAAIAIAKELQQVNKTAVYEVRPVILHVPGAPLS